MKIQIGVLVESKAPRNLLLISSFLDLGHCYRPMLQPGRALVGKYAVLED